jgi:hypothetical protein
VALRGQRVKARGGMHERIHIVADRLQKAHVAPRTPAGRTRSPWLLADRVRRGLNES